MFILLSLGFLRRDGTTEAKLRVILLMYKQRKLNILINIYQYIEQAASLVEKIRFQSDKEWGNGRV